MTRLLVLGLLKKYGAMSGYDIQIGLEETKSELWLQVKPASIYYALEKLEKEGFITLIKVEHTGNRSRSIYQITTSGEKEYQQQLMQKLSSFTVSFPTELYVAASFIKDLPKEQSMKAIDLQLRKIEQLIQLMQEGQDLKIKEGSKDSITQIIFRNIYHLCEIQVKCLEEIKASL